MVQEPLFKTVSVQLIENAQILYGLIQGVSLGRDHTARMLEMIGVRSLWLFVSVSLPLSLVLVVMIRSKELKTSRSILILNI